jgi:aminoglycoside phosphotransferase (APT) family kinase protein
LKVEYIPSPGGFGSMNFAIYDGQSSYHLRFRRTREDLSAWLRNSARLAERYRAPRLLGEIELAGRGGAVFERLPGKTPDRTISLQVLDEIVATLSDLHADRELNGLAVGTPSPARKTFVDYHMVMCEEDLKEIKAAAPLPFVDNAGVDWMLSETRRLRELASVSAAFDEAVSSPIHGDLWYGNVLVDVKRWWIIDWEDLKIGDPAHDLSLLLFPFLNLSGGNDPSRWLQGRSAAFMERFQLYARAALWTFVVDPLADWIEADSFPEVRDTTRTHREDLHRWALARYLALP